MRRFVRHPSDIPISVSVSAQSSEYCTAAMTDVSQGGMACKVNHDIAIGSLVDVDITSVSPEYHGKGKVIWCKKSQPLYEVGIHFVNTQEAYKSRMVQQVCQIEHYKKSVYKQEGRLLNSEQAATEWIAKYAESFPGTKN